MAYIYPKLRSPFWYVQYIDGNGRKHDKSTGLRTDDPNDTLKAKRLRAELEAKEYHRVPSINGAAWDSWVPKFFERHCQTERTLEPYLVTLKLRRDKAAKKPELTDEEILEIREALRTEPECIIEMRQTS